MFYFFVMVAGLLLAAFGWSQRKVSGRARLTLDLTELEDLPRQHVSYFAQVHQALKAQDREYLEQRGMPKLAREIQAERREIAIEYLVGLRRDFQKLLRMTRVLAVLSPEVSAVQEFERVGLALQFAWRYRIARLSLQLGRSPLPVLTDLCQVVSGLSVRLERVMNDLGEQTAAGFQLNSTLERRGLDNT